LWHQVTASGTSQSSVFQSDNNNDIGNHDYDTTTTTTRTTTTTTATTTTAVTTTTSTASTTTNDDDDNADVTVDGVHHERLRATTDVNVDTDTNNAASINDNALQLPQSPRHMQSPSGNSFEWPTTCCICIAEWEEGDLVTPLPCKHEFHLDCT
jgi:hypothetical protein